MDLTKIKRSNSEEQTIAFEFPSWMLEALEQESQRRDLPLQVIVKNWIEEKLASSNSLQTTPEMDKMRSLFQIIKWERLPKKFRFFGLSYAMDGVIRNETLIEKDIAAIFVNSWRSGAN